MFAEDRLTLGPKWSVVGGFRYEENQVRRWAISYPGGTRTDSFAFEKTFRNATWRAGVVYQPMPTLSLYGQYATGVDPLGTLTTVSTGQVAFSNARGNQVEAGAKLLFLNGRGMATLAAYRIVKTGLLAQRTLSGPVEQVGQRSAQGVEAAMSVDLPQGFGVEANGTLLDARFDDFRSGGMDYGGRTPPMCPRRWAISGCAGMRRTAYRRAPGCAMSGGVSRTMAMRSASPLMRRWTGRCLMRSARTWRSTCASIICSTRPMRSPPMATSNGYWGVRARWMSRFVRRSDRSPGKAALRLAFLTHRWAGIVACLFFAMWFASGLVMLYVPYPSLSPAQSWARAQPIDWARVTTGPGESGRRITLEMRGDLPVWRIETVEGETHIISAQAGRKPANVDADYARRVAARFSSAPVDSVERIGDDQWTVAGGFDRHRPLWKATLADAGEASSISPA